MTPGQARAIVKAEAETEFIEASKDERKSQRQDGWLRQRHVS